mmetsp:Transcript_18524/g.51711  ORF Transcript_18524/g.51711 Transcript_18524/m.51711 type:complete len:229 (-) Transcript_18524:911-1597(-)
MCSSPLDTELHMELARSLLLVATDALVMVMLEVLPCSGLVLSTKLPVAIVLLSAHASRFQLLLSYISLSARVQQLYSSPPPPPPPSVPYPFPFPFPVVHTIINFYLPEAKSISSVRLADRFRLAGGSSPVPSEAPATTTTSSSKFWLPVPNRRSPTSPMPGKTIPHSVRLGSTTPTVTSTSGWFLARSSRPALLATTVTMWIFGTPHFFRIAMTALAVAALPTMGSRM